MHLSALLTPVSCYVDVVKVRLMNDKARQFTGVVDCIRDIISKEGPLAFYKGFGMCWARVSAIGNLLPVQAVTLILGIHSAHAHQS